MAYLCYSYAHQSGRDTWYWIFLSLRFPYIVPLVLAFVPPNPGSAAEVDRRGGRRAAPAKSAAGPFETRFPLLSNYLANLPEGSRTEARTRMDAVPANFEFSVFAGPNRLDGFLAGVAAGKLTVWTNSESDGTRVFGAGMVESAGIPGITEWLRSAAPERKTATALHPAEGPTKYFEYYNEAS